MSWASRRRLLYLTGVFLVLGGLIAIPVVMYLHRPATCFDRLQNQGETAPDRGGPCQLLDPRALSPHAVLWTRALSVRDGSYNALAYIENPNESAGVAEAPYRFRLYDERNVLVAERTGSTFVMPGAITPVFEGDIDTGNRIVARAYFEFLAPLVWERLVDATRPIVVLSKNVTDSTSQPRLTAVVENRSVADIRDVHFVATVYDTAGNAFAASASVIPLFQDGTRETLIFTWPDPFEFLPGRVDVQPILPPEPAR